MNGNTIVCPHCKKSFEISDAINVNSVGMSDGLNYVDDCADIALHRAVFKLIFEALRQEQHYKMMMGESE